MTVLTDAAILQLPPVAGRERRQGAFEGLAQSSRNYFGAEMSVVDGHSGAVLAAGADQLDYSPVDLPSLCRQAVLRNRPEYIAECEPVVVLAVPWESPDGEDAAPVLLGGFLTRGADATDIRRLAAWLDTEIETVRRWATRQTPISPDTLLRLAQLALDNRRLCDRNTELEREMEGLSDKLCGAYEETSLIYRLTHNLTLSRTQEELGRLALDWVGEVLPVEQLALYLADEENREFLRRGENLVSQAAFADLLAELGLAGATRPVVVNRVAASSPGRTPISSHPPRNGQRPWAWPEVRQMILVPLSEGGRVFGWLAAFNHARDKEFGTIEADLLSSVAAILGVHRGNAELYREQAELMANLVRALTSAIDAKDPYTRGHSDRVARVAARLARELGCSEQTVSTIYLSGLLHDVGKIGIEDSVLRKPGKLTDEEYEHIKTHSQVGYDILVGVKQLEHVLPVVLHHHEAFDGSGYPHGLAGESIPFLARIAAVADAFDAMGSDRPYRKGMPEEKLDTIIRSGAGSQWDPDIVEAFFRARDDIRAIARGGQPDTIPDLAACFHAPTEPAEA